MAVPIRKKKMIFVAAMLVALAIAMLIVFPQGNQTASQKTIIAVYQPATSSLPLFVAAEEGLFQKEGINVTLERVESPNQVIDALLTGKAEAGAPSTASGINAIANLKSPGQLKVYGINCASYNRSIDDLLVPVNSSLTSIADLRGKKMGHFPGVQFITLAKKILIESNVSPSDVTLIELPVANQLPALSSGAVDAVLTLEPVGTIGRQKNVSSVLVENPVVKLVADPWCGGVGIITAKFISERPEEAKAFIRAMDAAMEETNKNQDVRQYLVRYMAVPEAVALETPLPVFYARGDINSNITQAYQKFADIFFELNVTSERPDVSRMFV